VAEILVTLVKTLALLVTLALVVTLALLVTLALVVTFTLVVTLKKLKIIKPCFIFLPYNQFDTILSGIVVFIDPENVCLDTKIMILSGIEAEILIDICFYILAILKMQDGCHNVFR
jgi:hypothetical protein